MNNKYPDDIMRVMRESLLLDDNDTKKDDKINKMNYKKVLKEVLILKHLLIVRGIDKDIIDLIIADSKRIYDCQLKN